MVLGWFVSNASEGLIGAAIVRRYVKEPLDFESFRQVSIFVVGAAFIGTFVSSFLDAGFVSLVGWSAAGYWDVWFTRTPANVLATMTLVPVIVTWANGGLAAASFGLAHGAMSKRACLLQAWSRWASRCSTGRGSVRTRRRCCCTHRCRSWCGRPFGLVPEEPAPVSCSSPRWLSGERSTAMVRS